MPLKFLCDENLPNGLLLGLLELGHDVKRLESGTSDVGVAACAKKEKRILLTLDGDFANILIYPPSAYNGVVRFRYELPTVNELMTGVTMLLQKYPKARDFKGKLIIISEDSLRVWGED